MKGDLNVNWFRTILDGMALSAAFISETIFAPKKVTAELNRMKIMFAIPL